VTFVTYRFKIWPYGRDAREGVKAVMLHRVQGKQAFPGIGQYFLQLDNPDVMHAKVNEATFAATVEGDAWPVFIAPRSRYVFDPGGRYTAM